MNNKFDDMQSDNDNFDDSKRKSLIKMGRRAVYMSPVVLTLLTSQKATAMSCAGGAPGNSACSSGNNPGGGNTGNGNGQTGNNG